MDQPRATETARDTAGQVGKAASAAMERVGHKFNARSIGVSQRPKT